MPDIDRRELGKEILRSVLFPKHNMLGSLNQMRCVEVGYSTRAFFLLRLSCIMSKSTGLQNQIRSIFTLNLRGY